MRTTVSIREFNEREIRTAPDLETLQQLAAKDIPALLRPEAGRRVRNCVACGAAELERGFSKAGLAYDRCRKCGTVFANPRPDPGRLEEYYRTSDAYRFWRERVFEPGRAARKSKIAIPNADWVRASISEHRPGASKILDISSNGRDHLEALLATAGGRTSVVAAHPLADLDHKPGPPSAIRLQRSPFEVSSLPGAQDVVLAFEFLDRTISPESFLDAAWEALVPGGLLFMTTPSASGFDFQTLGDAWPSLIPPDRLTIPTMDGLQALIHRRPWKVLELSTPGMFDVETVRQVVQAHPNRPWPAFERHLVERCGEDTILAFQEFLQSHRLSSFARVLLQREG